MLSLNTTMIKIGVAYATPVLNYLEILYYYYYYYYYYRVLLFLQDITSDTYMLIM
jgi:hypothetical protein